MLMSTEKKIAKLEKYSKKQKIGKLSKYADSKHPEIRLAVAKELAGIKTDESYNTLIIMLKDNDSLVRKQAVLSLGELGRNSAFTHINYILDTTTDPDLQKACRNSLSKIHNTEV